MQEYFSDEIVKNGISTSGWFQQDTVQHINGCFSDCIGQKTLDKFFELSTIDEQRIYFQNISSDLEAAILQVINITILVNNSFLVVAMFSIFAHQKRSCLTREHLLATGWTEKQLVDIEAIHGDVSQYFLKHFHRVCLTLPSKDNFYLSLLTRGTRGFSPDKNPELAPPFLQRRNFQRLKVYCYHNNNIDK